VIEFGHVLGDVQRLTGRSILVSWLGGEPLAWNRLPRLSRTFRREFGLGLGVTTNGAALAALRVRASLLADYEQVTVSVDGLVEFHDRVRGEAGLFEQLRANVDRLRSEDAHHRLWLRVNTVLMRGNIERFGEFCREMADWGFHELTFNQLGGNERPEFFAANRLLPAQVERFAAELLELRETMARRGLAISGSERYMSRIAATTGGRRIAIDDCGPGTEFLFIDVQGRISPCSFSSVGYGVSLAQVQSAEQFLQLPERFRQLRVRGRLAACDDCHATHVFDKFGRQECLPTDTGEPPVSTLVGRS
jgi:radical SAM protein with 4Fe4S-binding SPASM domain